MIDDSKETLAARVAAHSAAVQLLVQGVNLANALLRENEALRAQLIAKPTLHAVESK